VGFDKFPIIKPNVVALGRSVAIVNNRNEIVTGSGTSYASPIVAGLATCLWQAFPEKTNMDIFQAIEKSSSQYFNPDLELGFGIPNFEVAYRILADEPFEPNPEVALTIYPNPTSDFININFHESFEEIFFTLYNLMGKTIYTQSININGRISVSLPVQNFQLTNSGLYFIRIESQNGSFVQKIFINP
jgi:subtilisin family serine protease